MHYSSGHKILLVGEGDFSFSLCLAKTFGDATNMVATSLDSKESLLSKYSRAATNLGELEELGCVIVHEVDACFLSVYSLSQRNGFDRIIFNFPHAGFHGKESDLFQIRCHQHLVRKFLRSASHMLTPNGQIHVTHKTNYPFSMWEIEKLAKEAGLFLVEKVPFSIWGYPGYANKKGQGPNCDRSFPTSHSVTFKFGL